MNVPLNAIPEAHVRSEVAMPATISVTRSLYWSVQRELWENRSIYIAPLAAAGLFLLGFLISMIHLPAKMRGLMRFDPMRQREMITQPYVFAALLIMGVTFVVAVFYCLDALHGERRDRSILFWKSLPVSDFITVLSKASIPLLILPLITFAITIATQWIMLMVNSAVLLASGMGVAPLWGQLPLFPMWTMLLFHLLFVHGLWYAPFYGWLLLVSGWARRAPFLWASLPPVVLSVVEKIALGTSHFGGMLARRFGGGAEAMPFTVRSMPMDQMTHTDLSRLLMNPGLWIGLAIFAACLAGAVRVRRYQGPI